MTVFGYSAKVWALAILLMWGILMVGSVISNPYLLNFEPGSIGLMIIILGFSFLLSSPAWVAYMAIAYFICKLPYNYWYKKVLLAIILVGIMMIAFMIITEYYTLSELLNDRFTLTGLLASALSVFIIKLPSKNPPAILRYTPPFL